MIRILSRLVPGHARRLMAVTHEADLELAFAHIDELHALIDGLERMAAQA
jgi:hypothetical protein